MSAAWLPQPVMFDMSHAYECSEDFTAEQCEYYMNPWHFWYIADWVFALPTVAFFMCTIGVFIIAYAASQLLALSSSRGSPTWRRVVAGTRYLSYRGFHVKSLRWNSAPVGVLLLGLVGTIYFFCMDLVPSPYYWPGTDTLWGGSPPLATRSGWLALACMPFLFATASKTNWITLFTGVSHESLQVFHRWIAYAFLVLALMHTFPFIIWHIQNHDMVAQFTVDNVFEYWTGIVALLFQAWLTFASWGPIRSLGYEFFKAAHFFTAVLFMVVFFWHCAGTLTSWHYFVATAAVYVPCFAYTWLRTLFEYGTGQKAQIFVEENGFTRITIPANFKWQPGQHCFLRFTSFGIHALSSHPFTICSLPSISPTKPSEMTFLIRHQGGFTARLYKYALAHPGAQVPVLVDGPYGGIDSQKYFGSDRLVVLAGGSGVGWMLPFIEEFLRYSSFKRVGEKYSDDDSQEQPIVEESPHQLGQRGPQSLRVVLATRDIATRTWFHKTVSSLQEQYNGSGLDINVEVHLTGKAELIVKPSLKQSSGMEEFGLASSSSESSVEKRVSVHQHLDPELVQGEELRGRPDMPQVLREEAAAAAETGQTVGVFMCGPITMQNDVRNAVAEANLNILKKPRSGGMYLHLEHFSWA